MKFKISPKRVGFAIFMYMKNNRNTIKQNYHSFWKKNLDSIPVPFSFLQHFSFLMLNGNSYIYSFTPTKLAFHKTRSPCGSAL